MLQPDSQSPAGDEVTAQELQTAITDTLGLDVFPLQGYRNPDYLRAALAAGFTPADLATAHDVSRRSIYRAAATHDIELQQPPSTGPAPLLWEMDADAVPGESA